MVRLPARRSTAAAAAFLVLSLALASSPASAGNAWHIIRRTGPGAGPIPGTSCTAFPVDHIWNTDVSSLPVNAKSAAWLASMNAATTNLHPDFGRSPYGFPWAVRNDAYPKVSIRFRYRSESDPGPYPFGADIPVEKGSDRHALVIDKDTCALYELFAAYWNAGRPKADSGAIFDLGGYALRPDGWTSADAAGLAIFPGLVRRDEVAAGFIGHAIRFTAALTDCSHLWPARHDAGTCDPDYPPMGARFRLKADYGISGFSPDARVILQAMKTYGLLLADNGSDWYFQGTMDRHWSDALLDQLKTVPASEFEAVDESACMIDPDSGQAACP